MDIGPGAGVHGGELVAEGTVQDICAAPRSITGAYLSGRKKIEVPRTRRSGNGKFLEIKGAKQNNLQNINVKIPLGKMTCVTGISGSGKSSLINETLYKKLAAELNGARMKAGAHQAMLGLEYVDKVIGIDQSPIGRTPRSNPATYTGVFTDIRNVFSQTQEATSRVAGARPARATALFRSPCIFCRMFMFRARCAAVRAITGRRWRCATKAKPSAMC